MILSFVILCNTAESQDHGGFQQYYYTGDGPSSIVPKIYYQNRHNLYGELRYNYEAAQTVSFNAGKVFSHKNLLSYSITPVAGIVLGKFNGITMGTNIDMNYKKLFFSSEFQYTFSIEKRTGNFFLSWSEFGYQVTKKIYTGAALQVLHHDLLKNIWEPGIMMGLIYQDWTFPVYAFNLMGNSRNFVLGINWQWNYGK